MKNELRKLTNSYVKSKIVWFWLTSLENGIGVILNGKRCMWCKATVIPVGEQSTRLHDSVETRFMEMRLNWLSGSLGVAFINRDVKRDVVWGEINFNVTWRGVVKLSSIHGFGQTPRFTWACTYYGIIVGANKCVLCDAPRKLDQTKINTAK